MPLCLLRSLIGSAALVVGCLAVPGADRAVGQEQPAAGLLTGVKLVHALRQGGHVIYFRHAATERSQADESRQNLDNCTTQRNLSPEGRRQAQDIGVAFRKLGIPVGKVMVSPFCRTVDTGQLAFGSVEKSAALYFAMGSGPEERARQAVELRRMLGAPPPPGINTVLVSHHANLKEATGIWSKNECDAKVFRPRPGGGFDHVGEVSAADWTRWAQTLASQ